MIYADEHSISISIFLASIFLLSVVVEAVTEILTSSEISDPLRMKWKEWAYSLDIPPSDTHTQKFKVWLDKLISCGCCTSVWVAGFWGIWAPKLDLGNVVINWLIITFALHRFSTWLHVVYELVKKGRVETYDFEIRLKMDEYTEENDGSVRKSSSEERE